MLSYILEEIYKRGNRYRECKEESEMKKKTVAQR